MEQFKTRIITAALPFANNIPHLGNIVGSHLPADIFARYCRLQGYKTIFVGGTDEHGTATEYAAGLQNKTPLELCSELYVEHKKIYDWFGISYDNFSRTSRDVHKKEVVKLFASLYEKGLILEKDLQSPFCDSCERGLADRYIKGTCPKCKGVDANGDQCEVCGATLEAIELVEPYCNFCSSKEISFKTTKHLFLDVTPVLPKIEEWLNNNKYIRRQVKNLAFGWIKQGLLPRCITRDLDWGIRVPLEGYEEKVFYVWFENVIGYISATVELLGEEAYDLWRSDDTATYYFLGKDNIPFHTLYWPGELFGDGNYVLPHNVVGLQYLTIEGQKFSKSKGIGIFADDVVNSEIPRDYWRFYLAYIIPEIKDTNFQVDEFRDKVNKELIGNFGNFSHRTLSLIWQKSSGSITFKEDAEKEFVAEVASRLNNILELYEACELRNALTETLALSAYGNQYLNSKEPWKTGDLQVLANCAELSRLLALLLSPVVPDSTKEVLNLLNTENRELKFSTTLSQIKEPKIIFKRLEAEELEQFKVIKSGK